MGNLLSLKETFIWSDNQINRSLQIDELNNVIDKARALGDNIYKVPDLDLVEFNGENFFEFILYYGFDDKVRSAKFPWLTSSNVQILIGIIQVFQNSTNKPSYTLTDLDEEFFGENNKLIGFQTHNIQEDYVYDEETWRVFHSNFVSKFTRNQRKSQGKYFKEFYKIELKVDLNQINKLITRGVVHRIFKRIDPPKYIDKNQTLHGEQIQMHFNDSSQSALNIDGTWKHGSFNIPNEAKDSLVEWGFILPD